MNDMFEVIEDNTFYKLVDCKTATTKATPDFWGCVKQPCKKKKDENPMSSMSSATVITSDSIERDQRKFISSRLYDTLYARKHDLKRQFGLADDDMPTTAKEMLERVQAGKFVLPEKWNDAGAYSFFNVVRWRDPSLKEDKDGYNEARKSLLAAYESAEEAAKLLPIADATKAMQDFKNWKYEAKASSPAAT
jgi:hypothetical protein